jgi:hypothetical protein
MKAFALAFLVLFAGNALACSCSDWGTAREMLADADAAFLGNVASARVGEISRDSGEPLMVTTFRTIKAYKPLNARKFIVRSEKGDGGNCGTDFQRGVIYLVFAYKSGGKLYTDSCSISQGPVDREMRAFLLDLERASRE